MDKYNVSNLAKNTMNEIEETQNNLQENYKNVRDDMVNTKQSFLKTVKGAKDLAQAAAKQSVDRIKDKSSSAAHHSHTERLLHSNSRR